MNESVQKWLDELAAAPSVTVQKLVLGYAGVSAWSRSSLHESFVEVFHANAETLDTALTAWLEQRLMKLSPEETPILVWASHLQDFFSALAGLPLPQVAQLLRYRLRDFRSWLRPLRLDESLDPEAAYLAALAWTETNQHLEGMWQGLALRRDNEPAYYTDIGLLGLRKIRDNQGQLPSKPPFLLLATLIDLADTGISKKDWHLTTRALLGGYHYNLKTWAREFRPILEARLNAQNGPKWLMQILPNLHSDKFSNQFTRQSYPPAHSQAVKEAMIKTVAKSGPAAAGESLTEFLESERNYVNMTRDHYYLVRTFNRLAEVSREFDSDWAVARAEEALAWDEDNARNWSVLARCLWTRGLRAQKTGDGVVVETDFREALDALWEAQFRFPTDAYVRTELAKFLRFSGDEATAEVVYREAEFEFPRNSWSFSCMGQLLLRRYGKSGNEKELLESRKHFQKAAAFGDSFAQENLSYIETLESAAHNNRPLNNADLDQVTGTIHLSPQERSAMRPAQRIGRALLLQWQARHSVSPEKSEHFLVEAGKFLDLPDELTGECRSAFIEARGFLLLARGQTSEARSYFKKQLAEAAPRQPIGLRLGLTEARTRLGETLSDFEESELDLFGAEGSILPLVLKVVLLLESNVADDVLRELLIIIYPRVRDLAGMPMSELGDEEEPVESVPPTRQQATSDTMMAELLLSSVFVPAEVNTTDDLLKDEFLPHVREAIKASRNDIFAVVEKLVLAA